jgi:hypothetical protein
MEVFCFFFSKKKAFLVDTRQLPVKPDHFRGVPRQGAETPVAVRPRAGTLNLIRIMPA